MSCKQNKLKAKILVIVLFALCISVVLTFVPKIAHADDPIRFTQSSPVYNTAFMFYWNEYYQPEQQTQTETNSEEITKPQDDNSDNGSLDETSQDSEESQTSAQTIPPRYMLTVDKTTSTSVKNQGCMGSCWAFGAIAAAESSLINDGLADLNIDLSERHLSVFAHSPIIFNAAITPAYVSQTKNGEGFSVSTSAVPDSNVANSSWRVVNLGGSTGAVYKMFATNQGPASEDAFPYNQAAANTYTSSATGDWSIDLTQRFTCLPFDLVECKVLSPLYVYHKGTSQIGLNAIRNEIAEGRCVATGINVGSVARELNRDSSYSNNKFCYLYNYDEQSTNHEVTIVGYDDAVSAESFSKVDVNGTKQTPPGNGAFLVKDSVGDTFGVHNDGTPRSQEEIAANTAGGYYWVSYYDKTLYTQLTYRFKPAQNYRCYAYDYIANATNVVQEYKPDTKMDNQNNNDEQEESSQNDEPLSAQAHNNSKEEDSGSEEEGPLYIANVYTAEQDLKICDVSFEILGDTDCVTAEIRVLHKDDEGNYPEITDANVCWSAPDCRYGFGGYHRIVLDEPVYVRQGDKFALVLSHKLDNGYYAVPYSSCRRSVTGADETGYRLEGATVNCNSVINRGESLIFYNEQVDDLVDAIAGLDNNYTYQNFLLNAYTTSASEEEIDNYEQSYQQQNNNWVTNIINFLFKN